MDPLTAFLVGMMVGGGLAAVMILVGAIRRMG